MMPLISLLPPFMVGGVGGRLVMLVSLGGHLFELMLIGLSRFRYLLAIFRLDKLQVKQGDHNYTVIAATYSGLCGSHNSGPEPKKFSTIVYTDSVIAAMLGVWNFYQIRRSEPHLVWSHPKVVSGIALPVTPDKLYTRSKDETIRVWDF
nr:zinc finger CCCH domain-containing protein 48 [Tanacetum cinerariifolium]